MSQPTVLCFVIDGPEADEFQALLERGETYAQDLQRCGSECVGCRTRLSDWQREVGDALTGALRSGSVVLGRGRL